MQIASSGDYVAERIRVEPNRVKDPLNPARGMIIATAISTVVWVGIAGLVTAMI